MTDKIDGKVYLTPGEVAELLMVSSAAVRRWAADGELNALTTPGGHRRFLPVDVERFASKRNISIAHKASQIVRLLIVDDDKQFVGYLQKMLAKYSEYVVTEVANDGFDAGVKIYEFHPSIVLMDLMMPGIDGFRVCERIKSDRKTEAIRVIAMTGYPSASNTQKVLSAGAEECLSKPIDRKKLLSLIGISS